MISSEFEDRLRFLQETLKSGALVNLQRTLKAFHPAEIARLLESLPRTEREIVWNLTDPENDGEILLNVSEDVRTDLIRWMNLEELQAAAEDLAIDDLAELIRGLPETVTDEVLKVMDNHDRERLEAVLSYPEDTAGRLMNPEVITVRADVTLEVVFRYLRVRGEIPEMTDALFVVNRHERYLGRLLLSDLLTRDPQLVVAEVIDRTIQGIHVSTPSNKVAALFEDRDLISAPVIDDEDRLVGRITVDDVVDVIRDEADQSILSMVGFAEEENLFSPILLSAKRRAVWLGINLLTAILASWVVGLFEATLQQVVALAVLMPIVASMGGIAGSQVLTLVIRGQALGQVEGSNIRYLFRKEIMVSLLNGILWAMVVAVTAFWWFDSYSIGLVIAAALIMNLLIAAITGITIPVVMKGIGIDPALAGSVVLTTFTDVLGFLAFLGLGHIFLL